MDKVTVVADIGINHGGNIDTAKELIRIAAVAGCNYVKFQKRTIGLCYTKEELESPRISKWGTTFREQKEGLEFNYDDYIKIDRCCKRHNIQWFASPWDIESITFLQQFDMPFIKISSALMTNVKYLEVIKAAGIPVIISTGMCWPEQVKTAVDVLGNSLHTILACTSTYPTKTEEVNLNYISTLRKEYPGYNIGFSNHGSGILYCYSSVVLGAKMVEFHITLDRASEGSDQAASIEPQGVFKMIKYIRFLELALGDGVKKVYESELPIIKKIRKV